MTLDTTLCVQLETFLQLLCWINFSKILQVGTHHSLSETLIGLFFPILLCNFIYSATLRCPVKRGLLIFQIPVIMVRDIAFSCLSHQKTKLISWITTFTPCCMSQNHKFVQLKISYFLLMLLLSQNRFPDYREIIPFSQFLAKFPANIGKLPAVLYIWSPFSSASPRHQPLWVPGGSFSMFCTFFLDFPLTCYNLTPLFKKKRKKKVPPNWLCEGLRWKWICNTQYFH